MNLDQYKQYFKWSDNALPWEHIVGCLQHHPTSILRPYTNVNLGVFNLIDGTEIKVSLYVQK